MKTWRDIPGWFDFYNTYKMIVERYNGGLLVEVGNYLGKSLCGLGELVKESNKPFHIIGVDWCIGSGVENGHNFHEESVQEGNGSFASQLHKNVIDCGLENYITLIIGDSLRVSRLFPDYTITAVFLDGRHDEASVTNDIIAWYPKIVWNGILAGDDVGVEGETPIWPGIKASCDKLLKGWVYGQHDCFVYEKRKKV